MCGVYLINRRNIETSYLGELKEIEEVGDIVDIDGMGVIDEIGAVSLWSE